MKNIRVGSIVSRGDRRSPNKIGVVLKRFPAKPATKTSLGNWAFAVVYWLDGRPNPYEQCLEKQLKVIVP